MVDLTSIRACVFDLFHTLVSFEVANTPGQKVSEILGVDKDRWWRIWTTDSEDYLLGRKQLSEILPVKARLVNPAVTEEQIQQAVATRPRLFCHLLTSIEPETMAGLHRLTDLGLLLGLVSNCGYDEIACWEQSPLADIFPTPIFSCHVGLRKPDPSIYHLAASRLGVATNTCLFIGDGGSDEFIGARKAGMVPVLLTRHLQVMAPHRIPLVREQAEFVLATVNELALLLGA